MPAWLNLALTLFYVVWLLAVLLFLWRIWRNSANRAQQKDQALIDAATKSAEAAQKAAEAVYILAEWCRREKPLL